MNKSTWTIIVVAIVVILGIGAVSISMIKKSNTQPTTAQKSTTPTTNKKTNSKTSQTSSSVATTPVTFTKDTNNLVISNSHYEVAFTADHGGIAYIKDKQTNKPISIGNRDGDLWWAFLSDNTVFNSQKATSFSYKWNKTKNELDLHYGGKLKVDVTAQFSDNNQITLSANVVNKTGGTVTSFSLPYELNVTSSKVKDGLLPMLPGAKLNKAFFTENNTYQEQYPGVMFAPYIALRTDNGNLSMYDINGSTIKTLGLGFMSQVNQADTTGIVHDYKTYMKNQSTWQTPKMIIQVGGDYPSSIAQYRNLSGIVKYPSLTDKLGSNAKKYFTLPFYKMDISALPNANWSTLATNYTNQLDYSGVLHLVGFQVGGHDENYPNFLPADPKWGGTAAMESFIKDAKSNGDLVIPYTNFSWWGVTSPTLKQLPKGTTLKDIVVQDKNGNLTKENYGSKSGYVVDINNPFVKKRIAEEHQKFINAGFSGIFEDQWGIRDTPYVYNGESTDGNPSTTYFNGVQNYINSIKMPLYTEDGIDVYGKKLIGFMGTNLLWDKLGYRVNTASYTSYYPMIGMLERDKVMLYQHNLAAQTMTDNQDMLRWNLALGYNLSADLYNGVKNPWLDVIGVYQKYVLSNYTDQLVQSYKQVTPNVTKTDFKTYSVTANWDDKNAYTLNDQTTLAPGGFDVTSKDGSVRAGSYTRLNGLNLDPGEHNLVILKNSKSIRVFQPIGSDTTVQLNKGKWKYADAAAYTVDGTKIADLPVKVSGNYFNVDFIANILGKKVAYVQLTPATSPSTVPVKFHKVKAKTNLALGKPVKASSTTSTDYPAKQAVDGDAFTYWESVNKKFPQTLTVDLGNTKTINEVDLKLPPQTAWKTRQQKIEILGSIDGKTFKTIEPAKAYTFDPKNKNVVTIKINSAKTRYVQIKIESNSGWPAAQISEFEVYGQ